jgi:hypothetical protein
MLPLSITLLLLELADEVHQLVDLDVVLIFHTISIREFKRNFKLRSPRA